MIVAIEGASAAGKTTWCRSHFPDHVGETPQSIAAPSLLVDPELVASFWVCHAMDNWTNALEIEQRYGFAVCDGDPLHLYFSWALWRAGTMSSTLFEYESELYRKAITNCHIGFVDYVLWIEVPEDELRRRAQSDKSRQRKRHETYLGLVPLMKSWFAAREKVLPGTVNALYDGMLVEELPPLSRSKRYETGVLDHMLAGIGR